MKLIYKHFFNLNEKNECLKKKIFPIQGVEP